MKTRYAADRVRYARMTTDEVRKEFLIEDLFRAGELCLEYCEVERVVVGSAVPVKGALELEAGKELAADYFCERREAGVINIGDAGAITVDGKSFKMANLEFLYIGRGSKEVSFASADPKAPAMYYILSYPAHAEHMTTHAKKSDAEVVELGSRKEANVRTLNKYIHPGGIKSSQLVMGYTEIKEGSVWNTMPAHTHERRTEVYLYFNLADDAILFHLMGPPGETRHLVVKNRQAVVSPLWSIHSGVGTGAYCFVWGMGGENQDFTDMDQIPVHDLK
ncbi:MAG TPA: 5-dehydro-4-deoxy-D-glucuronate isomerase [bacterium]|nr:5-dehydro-4-deoxy-D-glucuronate isomerase [bacterium]